MQYTLILFQSLELDKTYFFLDHFIIYNDINSFLWTFENTKMFATWKINVFTEKKASYENIGISTCPTHTMYKIKILLRDKQSIRNGYTTVKKTFQESSSSGTL